LQYYFKLQLKRINRLLVDLGFNVVLGYALVGFVFIIASFTLFEKLQFAKYLYAIVAILPAYVIGDAKRNEYLKMLFPTNTFHKLRLLENFMVCIPFVVFLFFKMAFLEACLVLVAALSLSFFSQNSISTFALPTPFYKKPFEFIIGFRSSWLILLGCIALTIIGVSVDNFNLGVFALLVTQLTCLNFYLKPEPEFYVWVHAFTPVEFLWYKMFSAFLHSLILSAPISLMLLLFYPGFWYVVIAVLLLAVLYLWLSILGKYAYYPMPINLFQLFGVSISIVFPPFILISLPYFYVKAKQNLSISLL